MTLLYVISEFAVNFVFVVTSAPNMTFPKLLRKLSRDFPTVRAFAAALGVDPSHVSRAMSDPKKPFDVRGCLRLAKVTGAHPGVILRAARKGEIADLIEALYGAAPARLTVDQREIIALLDAMTEPAVRYSYLEIGRRVAGVPASTPQPRPVGRPRHVAAR